MSMLQQNDISCIGPRMEVSGRSIATLHFTVCVVAIYRLTRGTAYIFPGLASLASSRYLRAFSRKPFLPSAASMKVTQFFSRYELHSLRIMLKLDTL